MKRHEAIEMICRYLNKDDLVVSSTGNLSRELFLIADSHRIFYMMGSMGLASSIGLGLAICRPDKRVVIIEGDGSILMNMGSLATIGHYVPKNLVHIILDNEVYDSTGGQPSVSKSANLEKVALNVGYKLGIKLHSQQELKEIADDYLRVSSNGPIFILLKVDKGGIDSRIPRVGREPGEIADYFRKFITN